jgi:hypothetical protein
MKCISFLDEFARTFYWFSLTSMGHVGRFYFSNLVGVGYFFGGGVPVRNYCL